MQNGAGKILLFISWQQFAERGTTDYRELQDISLIIHDIIIVLILYAYLPSMVKWHNASFPLESRATQMTSVFPTENWLPDSLLQVKVGVTPELSFACGLVQTATAVAISDTAYFVWSTGQEMIVGSSMSIDKQGRKRKIRLMHWKR